MQAGYFITRKNESSLVSLLIKNFSEITVLTVLKMTFALNVISNFKPEIPKCLVGFFCLGLFSP